MTRPNGIATNYSYDNLSRLLSILHQAGGSTIDGASYTLDAAGNRLSNTNWLAGATTNYGYDSIYELLQATQGANLTENYTYDPVGNRLSSLAASYSVNSSNEMTAAGGAMSTYDANGNTTSKSDSTGTTTYAWDFENRLTSVTLPGTGGTVTFKYDPFGRRIEKISPSATSIFVYDGSNLIEEVNSSGAAVARYSQGLNIDEPLAMLRSNATSFYHSDGLGSVTSLSNVSGVLVQTYSYNSFGKQTSSSGLLTNPVQYTARELDSETNLYFYRARYFDPSTGRFLSEDPARFLSGVNFYAYVHNRPTLLRDATGRIAWGYGVGGAGFLSGGWAFLAGGVEGSFLYVQDSQGNSGILDCRGGGLGAGALGAGANVQGVSAVCPDCNSICDMQGTFGGVEGFAGAGPGASKGGGATVSATGVTVFGQYGVGGGAGGGVIGIVGDCTLIWKKQDCKSAPCQAQRK